jgi:uncharacterized C2H2 Zn-finger protein
MPTGTILECCGTTFADIKDFANHRQQAHGNPDGLTCCGTTFRTPDDYAEHQSTVHLAA